MSTENSAQRDAEAMLASLPPKDRELVEWVIANYSHTLATCGNI
jgi:hypothetical protein